MKVHTLHPLGMLIHKMVPVGHCGTSRGQMGLGKQQWMTATAMVQ